MMTINTTTTINSTHTHIIFSVQIEFVHHSRFDCTIVDDYYENYIVWIWLSLSLSLRIAEK